MNLCATRASQGLQVLFPVDLITDVWIALSLSHCLAATVGSSFPHFSSILLFFSEDLLPSPVGIENFPPSISSLVCISSHPPTKYTPVFTLSYFSYLLPLPYTPVSHTFPDSHDLHVYLLLVVPLPHICNQLLDCLIMLDVKEVLYIIQMLNLDVDSDSHLPRRRGFSQLLPPSRHPVSSRLTATQSPQQV